jgi:hypothetical protein
VNIFGQLRLVALVRRGVIALERLAASNETVAQVLLDRQQRESSAATDRKPRATELYQFDPAIAEKEWLREREEAARDGEGGTDG